MSKTAGFVLSVTLALTFASLMTATSNSVTESTTFGAGSKPRADSSLTVSQLSGVAKTVTRYVDGQLIGNCVFNTYSITNRNCTGSDGNAYRGIQAASNASDPGDTILIRRFGGIYARSNLKNGSSVSNRTTYQGYGTERPSIRGADGPVGQSIRYVFLKNLVFDGQNIEKGATADTYYSRFENIEVKNYRVGGIFGIGNSEMINLNVHHNSGWPDGAHGLYTGASEDGSFTNNLIEGGEYHHNSGFGIHCYGSSSPPWGPACGPITIRNVRVHHNGQTGLIAAFAPGVRIHNVIADHNGGHGIWIAAVGAMLDKATAYNNRANGICVDAPRTTVQYVIALQNSVNIGSNCNSGTYSYNASNNITSGHASSFFVDAANGNFTSKVKGVGANLREGSTGTKRY